MSASPTALPTDGPFDPAELLVALTAAPSLHNTQPWRVRRIDRGLQLRSDMRRWLPATDAGARELRLSCGAGLLNMRLALAVQGRRPVVELLPDRTDPVLLATIRPGVPVDPTPEDVALAAAIPVRHSDRRPFRPEPVAALHRHLLRRAAEREGAWLHGVTDPVEQERLRDLLDRAHRAQSASPAFLQEWEAWTGVADGEPRGVPARSGGLPPGENDAWMLRDFTGGVPGGEPDGPEFDASPLVLVISTPHDLPTAHLRAGQAMQRVLLTATALGLASSVLSAPVEVGHVRRELGRLAGRDVHPQILVRVGHGDGPPAVTPRVDPARLWG
ncbi:MULTISPECIES: nitroreductase family protein [unclassified Pseudonocardia]|uniref:Acg family FMN-binding oxidoreductase n=1 Tax=unclassified Pseudonocardia TaxID=2619320 RepID=UPI0009643D27|nr:MULTISPECIES: nitroreductase family protein [unclassified Pseudonocardia]MBN9102776.1 nitroreductase family protein [Pseudonocardia sp.]OJY47164.1 MAG: hypothetical protein BGP03_11620 [Pseudonocardia sp. 73-21]